MQYLNGYLFKYIFTTTGTQKFALTSPALSVLNASQELFTATFNVLDGKMNGVDL